MNWLYNNQKAPKVKPRLRPVESLILQERAKHVLLLATLLTVLFGVLVNIRMNLTYAWSSWSLGEWLVNYAGGFVRRGLPGQVIYYFSSNFRLPPSSLAIAISLSSWLFLSVILVKFSRDIFSPFLLFSSFCLASPLIGGYMVRKDCFNLVLLAIVLITIRRGANGGKGPGRIYCASAMSGIIGVVAVLSHESYAFYAIPSVLMSLWSCEEERSLKLRFVVSSFLAITPVLVVTVICFIFNGNPLVAEAINGSWSSLSVMIHSDYPDEPQGAIWAIGLSGVEGLKFSLKPIIFYLANGFIWRPLPLVASIFVIMNIVSSPVALTEKGRHFRALVTQVFLVILFCMAPIFVAGHDYGRWLFMVTTATILVVSVFGDYLSLNNLFVGHVFVPTLFLRNLSLSRASWFLVLLTWGVPAYWNGWSLMSFAQSSMLGYPAVILSKFSGIPFKYLFPMFLTVLVVYVLAGVPFSKRYS